MEAHSSSEFDLVQITEPNTHADSGSTHVDLSNSSMVNALAQLDDRVSAARLVY